MLIMTWSIKGGGWLTWDISVYKEACGHGSSGEVFILAHKTLFLHVHGNKQSWEEGWRSQEASFTRLALLLMSMVASSEPLYLSQACFYFSSIRRVFGLDQGL